jgi:uncharacterized protein (DUF983 family)
LDVLPPVKPATPQEADRQMADALTAQYERAVGGMKEVLVFGAMAIKVKEHVTSCVRTRTQDGRHLKGGDGFKAWLEEHAPEINRATAYRLLSVTESVQAEYEKIVGAKAAKQITLPELVTTPAADLPEALRAKQLDLFSYVQGTSQRSWLDKFKPAPLTPGGNNHPKCPHCCGNLASKASPVCPHCGLDTGAEPAAVDPAVFEATQIWKPLLHRLEYEGVEEKSWAHLPDKLLRQLKELLIELNKLVPAKG